jgi:hypothetical protein
VSLKEFDVKMDWLVVNRKSQRPQYTHATIEPVLQVAFSMWFAYTHC